MAHHYFGTDGFRGEANEELTAFHAYRIGRFLGWYHGRDGHRARIVIGKDTRRSSYMLEYAMAAGLAASGADAFMLHVTTTPSVAYVTREDGFDGGVMITASHNPFYDNGIKLLNRFGEKPDDAVTTLVEAYLDGETETLGLQEADLPFAKREKIGKIVDHVAGRNRYLAYLIALAGHSYKHLRIGLDCANGASWTLARSLFSALGAQVTAIGAEPDGLNVNACGGSTHVERLCALVKERHLDVGLAFDGDGDRCIAVDEDGCVVDGDKIMYILARRLRARGMLKDDTVVATVMSNSGFVAALEREGIACVQTTVGDRFVYEKMLRHDYSLGGEQSGHIILKKYATTGDGLLTAVMLVEEMCDTKQPLSKLCDGVTLYPQYTRNVRVKNRDDVMQDPAVTAEKVAVEADIGADGRVLIRRSGTEPVVRVMVECEHEELCKQYAQRIVDVIEKGGHMA